MKKTLLFALMAALALAGCKKDPDTPDEPVVPPVTDAYAAFKADATPRWESGTTVEKNAQSAYTFIIDASGKLFSSDTYKTGRMSADGSNYELIEFTGAPAVGKPEGATLRTPSGTTNLHSLEIVKAEGGTLWIAFKETADAAERRVVQ